MAGMAQQAVNKTSNMESTEEYYYGGLKSLHPKNKSPVCYQGLKWLKCKYILINRSGSWLIMGIEQLPQQLRLTTQPPVWRETLCMWFHRLNNFREVLYNALYNVMYVLSYIDIHKKTPINSYWYDMHTYVSTHACKYTYVYTGGDRVFYIKYYQSIGILGYVQSGTP